jgi:hypothetical protein
MRVEIPNRYGLLTMAGFTAAHSSEIQSSPVKRGAWVRSQLLCTALPPPPDDLGVITEPEAVEGQSTAEAFAIHRDQPACAGCHTLIDPVGVPFEFYDEMGRYRTTDRGVPVEAPGELTGTSAVGVALNGPQEFVTALAALPEAQACAVNQWFRYGMGRLEEPTAGDLCTVTDAMNRFNGSSHNLKDLIVGLATSDAFRFRVETAAQ